MKKQSKISVFIKSLKKIKGVGTDLDSQSVKITFNDSKITSVSLRDSVWIGSLEELEKIANSTSDKEIRSIKLH